MELVTLKADSEIENMASAMRNAGLPVGQAARFISAGYVAIEGMLPFHAWAREADTPGGPTWIALGGKRGPGKSHVIMAQVGLDDCQRHEDLKVLFLRKIQKAAAESLEDVIRRVFAFTPYTSSRDRVSFENGSRILIGGYKDEKDIDKYLGIEYDIIVVEECTQLIENKIDQLRGSLRTSKPAWRPRIYLSTNADGIGLSWFKRRFVEPSRARNETDTRFLDVSHIYNPFINDDYQAWLDGLKGSLRKAWRDGDWDAFAGMAFPQWNRDKHVIEPFDIPDNWIKWRATDWGYSAPFCTLWLAKNPDTRRIYIYRELYATQLTDMAQAQQILDATPSNEKITIHYADPALWKTNNKDGQVYTTADEYRKNGVALTKADNDRLSGKRKINNALADMPDGLPGLQIFNNCPNLIEQMAGLASAKNNPEDVDTDQEDHAYDTLRYGYTNEKRVEQKPPPKSSNPLNQVFGRNQVVR